MADEPVITAAQLREEICKGAAEITERYSYGHHGIEQAIALTQDQLSLLTWAVGRLIAIEEARAVHTDCTQEPKA